MPFNVPTFEQIRDAQLRDIKNQLPDADTGTDSDYGVRAASVAGVADGLYQNQSYIVRQIFPDTADSDNLELHAKTRNVVRKSATYATGLADITGTPGSTLTAGAEMRGATIACSTTENAIIGDDGTATVKVQAATAGAAFNVETPSSVVLVSPPYGINSAANVQSLAGGTDVETDASLLSRYLELLRRPPAGGNKYDYKRWALEVDGVTAAYVYPLRRGLGTVDIAITSSNALPSQDLINTTQAHIDDVRNVTAKNALVLAPSIKLVDFTVLVSLDGLTLAEATPYVIQAVRDITDRIEPGQPLILSQVETQVSLVAGVTDRDIIEPVGNVEAIVNAETLEWIQAGNIIVRLIGDEDQ
ncbi:baseplate J/gp47 family protein [Limnobaculum xujianqingii]|uniref:baseplate J/gp47 family protein n=1 Tax=Limnobaculum xujianqingii TaxID=2738837 RepID=UPI00112EDA03|nr:baseplate J/gp47 family protein [Limnobaculum xujianqingii]